MESSPARSLLTQRAELAAGIATIILGIGVIAAVPELRHCVTLVLHGEFALLRDYIRSLGTGGVVLLLSLMVVHAIVFYPSEIATTTAGWVYGFWEGLLIAVVGWFLAALLSYALGRGVGRPLLRRILGSRFEWLAGAMERGGTSLLISGRLIPIVPFALLGYVAGATRISLFKFSWTTVLGYLPLTVAVAYLGSQARTLSTNNPLVWAAVVFVVALVVGERFMRKRFGKRREPAQP